MAFIWTSKTRRSFYSGGKTYRMRHKETGEVRIGTERQLERRLSKHHLHQGVWNDPEPIPGYTEHQGEKKKPE